ncbi:EAL domain-containing protein [Xylophilus sp. Kf1]|nr:EAL domain-containing protein [Xylophilus sp. Kf1]
MTAFIPHRYDLWIVSASVLIAFFAAYIALDLLRRTREKEGLVASALWVAGAILVGTGIWSMHFLGMQAFHFPMLVSFDGRITLVSWLVAVVASLVALYGVRPEKSRRFQIAIAAGFMGFGISAMHFLGMQAMKLSPGIVWDPALVALSIAVAILSSAFALAFLRYALQRPERYRFSHQVYASALLAGGISSMHYIGMRAANIPAGSICDTDGNLGGAGLTALIVVAAGLLLSSALLISVMDSWTNIVTRRLNESLEKSFEQLERANAELQQKAFTDPLTGLANRLMFEQRLAEAIARKDGSTKDHREGSQLIVLFIDLDSFKPVNDSYGHSLGDAILQTTARRLLSVGSGADTVARVGGDQFLLLLEDVEVSAAVETAEKILAAVAQPFFPGGTRIQLHCSIGISAYPAYPESGRLIQNADAAMYAAKKTGGASYAIFRTSMAVNLPEHLHLQQHLAQAIFLGELSLHYQPKICSDSLDISGFEALLRWNHPTRGMISPAVFIPLAERSRLIGHIGNWVIDEACRQMGVWWRMGLRIPVAINFSAFQLGERDLPARIERALHQNGVPASLLLCEITESVAMEDVNLTQEIFKALADIGVFLSIDDFGTGYSSLNYLRQLPAQQLKIDRSFIQDIADSTGARSVVDAVISLAHALGLRVVAEGVETSEQRDLLCVLECDELQGFLFARPMNAEAVIQWTLDNPQAHKLRLPAH